MAKWLHIERDKIMPFVVDDTYSSRLLLDQDFLPEEEKHPVVQINEGTFAPNPNPDAPVEGAVHEADEIYVFLEGDADLFLDGECIHPKTGDVILIPAGVRHAARNRSTTKPFRLMTIWMDGRQNELYHIRKKAWNTSYRTIGDE